MGWSLSKTLFRTGAPALGMFITKSTINIANLDSGVGGGDVVSLNALMFGGYGSQSQRLCFC